METSSASEKSLESFVVMEFGSRTPPVTIEWIVNKIKATKALGGSELSACLVKDHKQRVHLNISH